MIEADAAHAAAVGAGAEDVAPPAEMPGANGSHLPAEIGGADGQAPQAMSPPPAEMFGVDARYLVKASTRCAKKSVISRVN